MSAHDVVVASADLELRPLTHRDLNDTLEWRNHADARLWFKHSDMISPVAHREWFESYLRRPNDHAFIVWADGQAVGQVAIYNIDEGKGSAEVGRFVVAPRVRGRGYMRRALGLLIEHATTTLRLRLLWLEVFASNRRAIDIYSSQGFVETARDGELMRMERAVV